MDQEAHADNHPSSGDDDGSHHGKKRKLTEGSTSNQIGMGQPLSSLRKPDLPELSLTSARPPSREAGLSEDIHAPSSQEWQTIENGRPTKKAKKTPKPNSAHYPEIKFSSTSRLQSQIKITDLQSLVLYILADGPSPQFVSVRHRNEIRKVVVLMVPGLEESMFFGGKKDANKTNYSPDDFYPQKLNLDKLPSTLQPFANIFEHLWPVKTPGDDKYGKMHSPFHAMLTAALPKSKEEKKGKGAQRAQEPAGWKNVRTRITEFIHTADELLENDYTLHPAVYDDEDSKIALISHRQSNEVSQDDGWVDTLIKDFDEGSVPEDQIEQGSLTAGREILAMDCEMCMTGENDFSLTRISIVSWDGSVVLDELVKPAKAITDYVTQYSGITEKMLEPITTTLQDIQKKLVGILNPHTILLGHSLNSDLTALKLTHPYIIDTALLFPHPRGPPLKQSLKFLSQKFLGREIQKGHGTTGPGAGHDSIEDARTCLDLVKQKCEKGREWGSGDVAGENIFKRVARTGIKYKNQGGSAIPSPMNGKKSAMVDWGEPRKGPGAAADFQIGCKSDEEVTDGIIRAVNGDTDGKEISGGGVDFVFGRLRELEALKGWWNNNRKEEKPGDTKPTDDTPSDVLKNTGLEDCTTVAAKESASNASSLPEFVTLDPSTSLEVATADLTTRLVKIYDALPYCTALIVYSGSGDPREMSRLQALQTQFKKEYKIKKWDQLSVKWTDVEEQALKAAVRQARNGVGFMAVK